MFGFFKKKSEEKGVEVVTPVHVLNDNLKVSFSRIRSDIEIVRNWLNGMRDKDSDQDRRISDLSNKIDELGEVLSYMQKSQHRLREEVLRVSTPVTVPQPPQIVSQVQEVPSPGKEVIREENISEKEERAAPINFFENLTETQQALFLRLGTLMKESGQEWLPLKMIAQEAYPEKEYGQVRSTISEYIDVLGEFNLVEKKRRGKQSYVSVTKKGKSLFEQNRKNEDVKVKKEKKN